MEGGGGAVRESPEDARRRAEAEAALAAVARDSGTFLSSSLGRSGRRLGDHFAGRDAGEAPDPAELWGRRIGRALSLIGVVFLTLWLGVQLGWWGR